MALGEFSKRSRRGWSEPFDDAPIEVGLKIRVPRRPRGRARGVRGPRRVVRRAPRGLRRRGAPGGVGAGLRCRVPRRRRRRGARGGLRPGDAARPDPRGAAGRAALQGRVRPDARRVRRLLAAPRRDPARDGDPRGGDARGGRRGARPARAVPRARRRPGCAPPRARAVLRVPRLPGRRRLRGRAQGRVLPRRAPGPRGFARGAQRPRRGRGGPDARRAGLVRRARAGARRGLRDAAGAPGRVLRRAGARARPRRKRPPVPTALETSRSHRSRCGRFLDDSCSLGGFSKRSRSTRVATAH